MKMDGINAEFGALQVHVLCCAFFRRYKMVFIWLKLNILIIKSSKKRRTCSFGAFCPETSLCLLEGSLF